MQIKIKFFGKSKELEPSGNLILNFDKNVLVSELREILIKKLSEKSNQKTVTDLINDCAIGNSEQVLRGDFLISENQNLVILPPVCGG